MHAITVHASDKKTTRLTQSSAGYPCHRDGIKYWPLHLFRRVCIHTLL